MALQCQISDTQRQSMDELLGLARGLMADRKPNDGEIEYRNEWLGKHSYVKSSFPGSCIHERIREVLADGMVTPSDGNNRNSWWSADWVSTRVVQAGWAKRSKKR